MKDEQLIHNLQLLKKVQPNKNTLQAMKQRVYQQVGEVQEPQTAFGWRRVFTTILPLRNSHKIAVYAAVVVGCVLFFFFVVSVIFPNQLHTVFLQTRLAVAPNHYEKAQIAFADTTEKFANGELTQKNAPELSQSLALTNEALSNLKLKGEQGKYTSEECQQVYREYLLYLEKQEKRIPENDPMFSSLKTQISSYEEQAEKKLNMYHSL